MPNQPHFKNPNCTRPLTPELEELVEEIIGLRALTKTTGFLTYKTQREMLARLSPPDAAAVGRALALREKEAQAPIYQRNK